MENNNTVLSFEDKHHNGLLRGHVRVLLENPETKERTLWYENDNIIPISGMDVILMKMFNLHLDSSHNDSKYENIGQDTNLVIPDLNYADQMNIGIDPSSYDPMTEDIASNYFIQGFMVGNGGSGEDTITSKNTDYSYINLRSPIPFQQATEADPLSPDIAGKYLGNYRQSGNYYNYYIKKFDSRPHLVHSWWKENQAWDYVDPVTQADLGPNSNQTPRTNRIETYAEAEMSINIKDGDCKGYFDTGAGQGDTAQINEIGLVAFDTRKGTNSTITDIYNRSIKRLIEIIFDDNNHEFTYAEAGELAQDIIDSYDWSTIDQSNITAFIAVVNDIAETTSFSDWTPWQNACESTDNIHVTAYYKHNHDFAYATDEFMDNLEQVPDLTYDEANRIKLVTYYTFDSIPLKENWNIIINYRIYAN